MPNSVNVLFKKGLLTELFNENGTLKSGITPVNGAIYFAVNKEDSGEERGKLYLGEDNKLIPIGEDITLKSVADISALPQDASKHKGEFYYCITGNILAYSDGTNWVQVNTNTTLEANGQDTQVSVASNAATISHAIKDTGTGTNQKESDGSFKLTGGSNVTVAAGTGPNNIEISAKDTTYDLGVESAGQDAGNNRSLGVNVTLTDNNATPGKDSIQIKSTDSVIAKLNNGAIELEVDTSGVGSVTSVDFGGGQSDASHDHVIDGETGLQGFHISVRDSSNGGTCRADNLNPKISIKNAAGTEEARVAFTSTAFEDKSPVAALDVYSTTAVNARIDELKRTINAMTYRGAAGSLTDVTTPSGGLHHGDVFVATNAIDFAGYTTSTGSPKKAEPGYLIIVEGTENNNGVIADPSTATYTIVKANDTDTTYTVSAIANGIQINEVANGAANAIGSLTVSEGSVIDVVESGIGANKTVTINHADVTSTTSTASATATASTDGGIQHTQIIGAVTGVTVDSKGHVTNVTTSSITLNDTQLKSVAHTASATGSSLAEGYVATVTTTVGDSAANELRANFSLKSNTLEMAEDNGQVAINLIWGSF